MARHYIFYKPKGENMNVLVAGANGNIGKQIVNLLLERDHNVRAMVQDSAEAAEFERIGAQPVIADLEQDVRFAVEGCDAVVFAAGAGEESDADKIDLVDKDGAIKLIKACEENAVNRFIMLSSMGTDNPDEAPSKLQHYLKAKAAADTKLKKSRLNYTIIKPGRLTDNDSTGKIRAAKKLQDANGEISRADVAATVAAALNNENSYRKSFEILAGDDPVSVALVTLPQDPAMGATGSALASD